MTSISPPLSFLLHYTTHTTINWSVYNQSINQSIKAFLLSFCCTNNAVQQKWDYISPGSRSLVHQSKSLWKEAVDKSVSSTFMTSEPYSWWQHKECVERRPWWCSVPCSYSGFGRVLGQMGGKLQCPSQLLSLFSAGLFFWHTAVYYVKIQYVRMLFTTPL